MLNCNRHLTRMAAILDFANMAATWGARLGSLLKSNQYDMGDLWAKFGAFGRIWTKISLTPLTSMCTSFNSHYLAALAKKTLILWKSGRPLIDIGHCLVVFRVVYTSLFQFDCETSNVSLCKSGSNPFLEPTSIKQWG